MSRGPGRVMRAVVAAVEADPHHAVTIDEVCEQLYPPPGGAPAKKHRVAVTRAGKTAARRGNNIGYTSHMGPRNIAAFYAADDLKAYACAQLKALGWWNGSLHRLKTTFKNHMEPGGIWWLEVQLFVAERDGDADRAAEHRRAIERYEKGRQKALAGPDIRSRSSKRGRAGGHDEKRS
jgi:hypothetical protein